MSSFKKNDQVPIAALSDSVSKFLVDFKNAVNSGQKKLAKALITEEVVEQIDTIQDDKLKVMAMSKFASAPCNLEDYATAEV